MFFCKFSNILGKPREGVHAYRVADLAVIDVFLTIVAAIASHSVFSTQPLIVHVLAWFMLGIVAHHIFCVRTTVALALARTFGGAKKK